MRQNSTMPVQVSMAGYVAAWGEILNMGFVPAFSGTVVFKAKLFQGEPLEGIRTGQGFRLMFSTGFWANRVKWFFGYLLRGHFTRHTHKNGGLQMKTTQIAANFNRQISTLMRQGIPKYGFE